MRWTNHHTPHPGGRRPAGAGERTVPADQLAAFARALFGLGYGVEPVDVAERFGVPEPVAARALAALVGARMAA